MGWDGGGGGEELQLVKTVCHVCCTSSEKYHTKPSPVECPTVSVYQRQGGVGWNGGGGESYNLLDCVPCMLYI